MIMVANNINLLKPLSYVSKNKMQTKLKAKKSKIEINSDVLRTFYFYYDKGDGQLQLSQLIPSLYWHPYFFFLCSTGIAKIYDYGYEGDKLYIAARKIAVRPIPDLRQKIVDFHRLQCYPSNSQPSRNHSPQRFPSSRSQGKHYGW